MSIDSNSNLNNDGFQKITYKRKFRKSKPPANLLTDQNLQSYLNFNEESCARRISDAKLEIATTDLFDSVKASLKEGLFALRDPVISEVICFGLGRIGECTIARYQLALLLCLKELYNVEVYAYDPIFNENDIGLLNRFSINILENNLEGKYKVKDKKTTLFYLPHCPKQLTNNLLWANWGLDLNYCVIVCNSFNKVIEYSSQRTLLEHAAYISQITPYVLELAVINTFKYFEVFNDTSIHIFPKLNLIPFDFWDDCPEPKYSDEDIEFITRNVDKLLI